MSWPSMWTEITLSIEYYLLKGWGKILKLFTEDIECIYLCPLQINISWTSDSSLLIVIVVAWGLIYLERSTVRLSVFVCLTMKGRATYMSGILLPYAFQHGGSPFRGSFLQFRPRTPLPIVMKFDWSYYHKINNNISLITSGESEL